MKAGGLEAVNAANIIARLSGASLETNCVRSPIVRELYNDGISIDVQQELMTCPRRWLLSGCVTSRRQPTPHLGRRGRNSRLANTASHCSTTTMPPVHSMKQDVEPWDAYSR